MKYLLLLMSLLFSFPAFAELTVPPTPPIYETADAANIKFVTINKFNKKIIRYKHSAIKRVAANYARVIEPRGDKRAKCEREALLAKESISFQKLLYENAASVTFVKVNANGNKIDFLVDGNLVSDILVTNGYALYDNGSNSIKDFCNPV